MQRAAGEERRGASARTARRFCGGEGELEFPRECWEPRESRECVRVRGAAR